jgi:hypothetical protein
MQIHSFSLTITTKIKIIKTILNVHILLLVHQDNKSKLLEI